MKRIQYALVLSSLVVLTACVPSLHPLYHADNLIADSKLEGVWLVADDGEEMWRFQPRHEEDQIGYRLTLVDDGGRSGVFDARLLKIDGQRYLDLAPDLDHLGDLVTHFFLMSLVSGHLWFKVHDLDDSLSLSVIDGNWLRKHLKKNPDSLAHRVRDERPVITASTGALQKFVREHDKDLWSEAKKLVRSGK